MTNFSPLVHEWFPQRRSATAVEIPSFSFPLRGNYKGAVKPSKEPAKQNPERQRGNTALGTANAVSGCWFF